MIQRTFTCIGTRQGAREHEYHVMQRIAAWMTDHQVVGLSGNATGIDQEWHACLGSIVAFLPWASFEAGFLRGRPHTAIVPGVTPIGKAFLDKDRDGKAREGRRLPPERPGVTAIKCRNVHQVVGWHGPNGGIPMSSLVIAVGDPPTPGYHLVDGGTDYACRVARYLGIPWINLRVSDEAAVFQAMHVALNRPRYDGIGDAVIDPASLRQKLH
jgi:hypothetical protein